MEREPLSTVAVVVGAIASLLLTFGVHLTSDQVSATTNVITLVAPFAFHLIAWWVGRKHVTPLTDPQDSEGNPLTPAGPVD